MLAFFIGVFVGACLGLLVAGLLGMAYREENDW